MSTFCRSEKKHNASDVSLRISSLYVCNNLPLGAYGAVCFLAISVPTILDLGDSSCEHSYKNRPSFGGFFSESSRQNLSGGSPLNQQCMNLFQTHTGGLQVRKKYF